jgi:predicted Rossmann-fold nucleotide-binding protein
MEAANLGALAAGGSHLALERALETLGAVPGFRPSVTAWARSAFAARGLLAADGGDGRSLGIPTWFYGHEPPNAFASQIAKYFQNSVREDTLLRHCRGGIVFLPGSAGTVQEVFQAACENYYARASRVAPMVLVGVQHWTETLPVWPLLEALATGRAMEGSVHLVETVDDVVGVLSPTKA